MSSNLPKEFASFKQYCQLIFSGPYSGKSEKEKASFFLLWIGQQGRDIYNSWTFADDSEREQVDPLVERFEKHLQPKVNSWLSRFELQQMRQNASEPVDDFVARCRNVAAKCKFSDEVEIQIRLIEQLIIGTHHLPVQKKAS